MIKRNINNITIIAYMFFISLLDLVFTFMIKYDLNSIHIMEYNIFYIGNLLPIIIEIVFIIVLLLHMYTKKNIKISNKLVLFLLVTFASFLIILSYFVVKLNIPFPQNYIFNYPIKKVVIGCTLLLAVLIKLFLISFLLNIYFYKGIVVYLKSVVTTILVITISFAIIFVFTTKRDYSNDKIEQLNNNIGVVLGAAVWNKNKPSPIFRGRIEKAGDLIKLKKIAKLQLTGGSAPGEISEARTAYNYAINLGIKKQIMQLEEETSTTTEQIKYIKKTISNDSSISSILIISDQFHLARVLEICKFFNVNAIGIESDYNLTWKKLLYYRLRESVALLFFWLFAI